MTTHNLPPRCLQILTQLFDWDLPIRYSEFRDHTGLTDTPIKKHLSKLDSLGFIVRGRDGIELTDNARVLRERMIARGVWEEALGGRISVTVRVNDDPESGDDQESESAYPTSEALA